MKALVLTVGLTLVSGLAVAGTAQHSVKQAVEKHPIETVQVKPAEPKAITLPAPVPVQQAKDAAKPAPVHVAVQNKPAQVEPAVQIQLQQEHGKFVKAGRLETVRDRAQREERLQRVAISKK